MIDANAFFRFLSVFFFFNDTAPTEIYTLSLHDALPVPSPRRTARCPTRSGHLQLAGPAFGSPCRLACLIPGQPRARLGESASHVLVIQAHMRHLYQKLGAHRRSVAVEQARALGLLASSARRP